MQCYSIYTKGDTGSNADYPLCAVELTADMAVVRDTPTCYRRRRLSKSLRELLFTDIIKGKVIVLHASYDSWRKRVVEREGPSHSSFLMAPSHNRDTKHTVNVTWHHG